jgi:hypothetical protein
VKRQYYKYCLNSESKETPEDLPDHDYELDHEGDPEDPSDKKHKDIDYTRPFVDDLKDPDTIKRDKKAELVRWRFRVFFEVLFFRPKKTKSLNFFPFRSRVLEVLAIPKKMMFLAADFRVPLFLLFRPKKNGVPQFFSFLVARP